MMYPPTGLSQLLAEPPTTPPVYDNPPWIVTRPRRRWLRGLFTRSVREEAYDPRRCHEDPLPVKT